MSDYIQTANGLIVPASFADAPARQSVRPDMHDVATTRDGRDITRGYVDPMMTLQPQDSVLLARGGGNYELYREVLRDDQVASAFAQRQLAVTSCEWEVRAGGDKRQDKKAADFLREQLQSIEFDRVTKGMLYGVYYGYAVAEMLWARDGAQIVIDQIRVRDRRRFAFDGDMNLRLLTMQNPMPGELLPPRKFWSFCTGADHDDEPYGLGLAHWLYWPVLFRRNGIKFWLIFLEKFGQPTAKGSYPTNATEAEKSKLLDALGAITTDAGVIVPEGMVIELLEAARSGTADYTAMYDRMGKAIDRVVLGQTASTEGTPGKLGNEQLQSDVRNDIVKADADLVCMSFNRGPVRWLTDWNFPGAAYPQVWRIVDEPEDLNEQAKRDQTLTAIGFRPTLARVRDVYGDEYEDTGAPVGQPQAGADPNAPPPPKQPPAQFAETDDNADEPGPAELIAARIADQAQPALADWIERISGMVDRAQSLDELKGMIVAAYADLPADEMGTALAAGILAAQAAGRFDANGQSE